MEHHQAPDAIDDRSDGNGQAHHRYPYPLIPGKCQPEQHIGEYSHNRSAEQVPPEGRYGANLPVGLLSACLSVCSAAAVSTEALGRSRSASDTSDILCMPPRSMVTVLLCPLVFTSIGEARLGVTRATFHRWGFCERAYTYWLLEFMRCRSRLGGARPGRPSRSALVSLTSACMYPCT